jgi:hypothetical protein
MSKGSKNTDPRSLPKPAKRVFNPNRTAFVEKVGVAYEALLADGDPAPSERAVRRQLGGGSATDINAALKIIRGELWCRHEPVIFRTRYTSERATTGGGATHPPVEDPTI